MSLPWCGGWHRWSPEVPSNPDNPVILWLTRSPRQAALPSLFLWCHLFNLYPRTSVSWSTQGQQPQERARSRGSERKVTKPAFPWSWDLPKGIPWKWNCLQSVFRCSHSFLPHFILLGNWRTVSIWNQARGKYTLKYTAWNTSCGIAFKVQIIDLCTYIYIFCKCSK